MRDENHSASGVQFDHHHFVLGMEWRLLPPAEKIVRHTLSQLRKEGMKWYASSLIQDIVGICTTKHVTKHSTLPKHKQGITCW